MYIYICTYIPSVVHFCMPLLILLHVGIVIGIFTQCAHKYTHSSCIYIHTYLLFSICSCCCCCIFTVCCCYCIFTEYARTHTHTHMIYIYKYIVHNLLVSLYRMRLLILLHIIVGKFDLPDENSTRQAKDPTMLCLF